jgi:phosphate:Na+ symporter
MAHGCTKLYATMNWNEFDFWMFFAGLGIFLFGMYHLENGLNGLAGNSFKKFLKKSTKTRWKGILSGTFVTAILQSSSLVTLLTLAFLSAGIISFQNSLGVVLGANLGTTVTAWLVASLGFKADIADLSFPFLAIGILSYLFMENRPFLKYMGAFLVGFGLLFLGLDYMKYSIEALAAPIDLSEYAQFGLWVFLLIGLIITALIQSSSALIVIVLSALNAGIVDIYQSTSMVIGASIGTTSTLLLASLDGTPDKKRLAWSNVIFKGIAGIITFLILNPLVNFTINTLNIKDPLMELVFLNTAINIIGIAIFYPFLVPFGNFMSGRFQDSMLLKKCVYITHVTPEVVDISLEALDKEMKHIFKLTQDFILDVLFLKDHQRTGSIWLKVFGKGSDTLSKYNHLKIMEDEITGFYAQIQKQNLSNKEAVLLTGYMSKIRALVDAAKNIKDIVPNIREMKDSGKKLDHDILRKLQEFAVQKIEELDFYYKSLEQNKTFPYWQMEIEQFYEELIIFFYDEVKKNTAHGTLVSTMTNAIKKTISSLESLALYVSEKKTLAMLSKE